VSQEEYIFNGDVTAAVIEILGAAPEIQDLDVHKITSTYIGYTAGQRWIIIDQHGGTFNWPHPSRPRVDIECIAETRSVACKMINTCIAVMFREQHNYASSTTGVRLAAVKVETAPYQSTEKWTDEPRYLTALRVIARPYPE